MFQYLAITDGTTLCELTDNQQYALVSYAPTIAPLRDNELGGSGPFDDVQDTLVFHALGETAAEAYQRAATLNRLIDQARRWWRGEAVSAVTIVAQSQGTTNTTSFTAAIKGRAVGGPPNMALPAVWSEYYNKYIIQNIQVQFGRRSLWLNGTQNASAGAAANPALLAISMPTAPTVPGPLEVDFTGFTSNASGAINIPNTYIFVAPSGSLDLQEGESKAGVVLQATATYTTTADAAARASAGSVGRLSHATVALTAESQIYWTLPAAALNWKRIAIYCTYRTNTNAAWTIRGFAYNIAPNSTASTTTPYTAIPGAASNPTLLFVGIVGSDIGFDTAGLRIARTTSVGTDTIDIDTVVFMDASDPEAYAVALNASTGGSGTLALASKNVVVSVDHSPNSRVAPFVHIDYLTTTAQFTPGYSGDAALTISGQALVALWYATNGTFWTTQNVGGSATLSIGATITRSLAKQVPE